MTALYGAGWADWVTMGAEWSVTGLVDGVGLANLQGLVSVMDQYKEISEGVNALERNYVNDIADGSIQDRDGSFLDIVKYLNAAHTQYTTEKSLDKLEYKY